MRDVWFLVFVYKKVKRQRQVCVAFDVQQCSFKKDVKTLEVPRTGSTKCLIYIYMFVLWGLRLWRLTPKLCSAQAGAALLFCTASPATAGFNHNDLGVQMWYISRVDWTSKMKTLRFQSQRDAVMRQDLLNSDICSASLEPSVVSTLRKTRRCGVEAKHTTWYCRVLIFACWRRVSAVPCGVPGLNPALPQSKGRQTGSGTCRGESNPGPKPAATLFPRKHLH